jgi:acetylornithine/succinyldiaminopimelate/putrescine aminotransferase/predicted amino acid dehydrogenase
MTETRPETTGVRLQRRPADDAPPAVVRADPGPDPTADYTRYARPWLGELLAALRLDVVYTAAEGSRLTTDGTRAPATVIDAAGGYGATLFGHHHPRLAAKLVELVTARTPVLVPGAVRPLTAALARELSARAGRGEREYVVTLTSTGAETVEAALKHAQLARHLDGRELADRLAEDGRRAVAAAAHVPPDVLAELRPLGYRGGTGTADAVAFTERHNAGVLAEPPRFLALARGFHGKTTGAVQLTHDPAYRDPFDRRATLFAASVAEVEAHLAACRRTLLGLAPGPAGPRVVTRPWTVAGALFAEPVQGEGGVRPLSPELAAGLCAAARAAGVPVAFDEIQCGLGRTGTFTHAEQLGVTADYVLLGKSLGGGLVKIGALLVAREHYRHDFGRVHTSTFAEDDLSSGVALEALRVLDDEALPTRAAETGAWLRARLDDLRARYPDVVADVRGAGLMLGVELARQDASPSPAIGALARQGFLAYVVAGYLLHEHGVRVAPTLSSDHTLRIQPAATIGRDDAERVVRALDGACHVLRMADAHALTAFVAGASGAVVRDHSATTGREPLPAAEPALPHVAFLSHFSHATDLPRWDPSLAEFTEPELERLLDRVSPFVAPQAYERHVVTSATGQRVQLTFLGAFTSSRLMAAALRTDVAPARATVRAGLDAAVAEGCAVLGLGAYTSIVTANGRALPGDRIALTTGNALTVAMGLRALERVAAARGIDLGRACFAALGAGGNVASVYAELLADRVPRLVLVGREGREDAVLATAERVYRRALGRLLATDAASRAALGGVAGRLAASGRAWLESDGAARDALAGRDGWRRLHADLVDRYGDEAPVRLATDLGTLAGAHLVLGASNSPEPLIRPEHLGPDTAVICDVSVPPDTSPEVLRERPDVRVLAGGVVRLPRDPGFAIHGSTLAPGLCYACMAETLLLGLEGIRGHFSHGRITADQVERIGAAADRHGFTLAEEDLAEAF